MGGSPERPKGNIIKNATRIAAPVIITLLSACSPHYTADIPPCDTDPQPKTQSYTLLESVLIDNPHSVKIDNILIKKGRSPGIIDIDQSNQPENHKLMFLSDNEMKFSDSRNNGRTYIISKKTVGLGDRSINITIQADCDTTPKTNP